MKIEKKKLLRGLPLLAVGAISAVAALTPIVVPLASAVDATGTQTVQVTIGENIGVAIDGNKTTLQGTIANPTTASLNDEALRTSLTVTNNVARGYRLTMAADATQGTSMKPTAGITGATDIVTKDGAPTAGTSSWAVKWGATAAAAQSSTNWKAVPASDSTTPLEISSNAAPTGGNATVQFGVAVANNQAATTYTGKVVYSVTANAEGGSS